MEMGNSYIDIPKSRFNEVRVGSESFRIHAPVTVMSLTLCFLTVVDAEGRELLQ